jgi:hypothetical protein
VRWHRTASSTLDRSLSLLSSYLGLCVLFVHAISLLCIHSLSCFKLYDTPLVYSVAYLVGWLAWLASPSLTCIA